ncbi:MAG: glycosyltransferase family 1 protein [Verrucomicrobiota bacterium]
MRLLIDLQVCQGAAKTRGMGRYSLSLAKAMIAEAGGHDVVVAASTAFPQELVGLRREFKDLLPPESIVSISLPRGTATIGKRPWLSDSAARWHRQQLLDLRPDAIHVANVFSGFDDDVTVPRLEVGDDVLWAVTLYDLIPLVRPDEFLDNKTFRDWYKEKLENLSQADLLLAISEASRTDAIHHLGLPADSVRMVGAAIEPGLSIPEASPDEAGKLLRNLGIHGDFVFYLGGRGPHKNFDGLLKGYALLPESLRKRFKLVLAGQITAASANVLRQRQHAAGLKSEDVLLLEKLSDEELSALYAQCHAFVFPSHYEGFGLPILEAMSCGAPVICSNTSSMLEVVGDAAATFDPADPLSISRKLQEVLEDDDFRLKLMSRAKQHAETFKWQTVAKKTWTALEEAREKKTRKNLASAPRSTMKIAVVASGPAVIGPARSLISRLFPECSATAGIDWVFPDEAVFAEIEDSSKVRSAEWLTDHACELDHIFHWIDGRSDERWIRPLVEKFPGIVVILGFFTGDHLLSGIASAQEVEEAVWRSHGYDSHVFCASGVELDPTSLYPCNFWLFENAVAVVSPYPWLENEAKRWYGSHLPPFEVFSQIAPATESPHRLSRREKWNAESQEMVFLVWSEDAGSDRRHRTLVEEAWRLACLQGDATARMEFWTDSASLQDAAGWIEGCDVLVVLRGPRRGGESRVVIQALESGKRVISMMNSSNPKEGSACDTLIQVSSATTPQELSEIFCRVLKRPSGATLVSRHHDFPEILTKDRTQVANFAFTLGREAKFKPRPLEVDAMATALARKLPRRGPHQFLIDVTEMASSDAKTGIQRVVRCILNRFLKSPPAGFRVEPVRCSAQLQWVYARNFSRKLFEVGETVLEDEPMVEVGSGDIFLALDLNFRFDHPLIREELDLWRDRGVFITGIVYDLLPMLNPQWFSSGLVEGFARWLGRILEMDAVIAISETVSLEIAEWLEITEADFSSHPREPVLGYFHLGADVEETSASGVVPKEVPLPASPPHVISFLMVGTIEPRKGHDQVLSAFEHLWKGGSSARLVIVGKRGWQVDSLMTRIKKHPELGKRLIWLEAVGDDELLGVYARCQVLLAASFGEGFGLPLIEGARHGLPIIARDIPVFREVAGPNAFYFSANHPEALALELKRWLEIFGEGTAPRSDGMKWLTWEQSADNLWSEIARCRDRAANRFDAPLRMSTSNPGNRGK